MKQWHIINEASQISEKKRVIFNKWCWAKPVAIRNTQPRTVSTPYSRINVMDQRWKYEYKGIEALGKKIGVHFYNITVETS